eukprot:CAMPEP_0172430548 /NCGR_PEP_ID=MMETSP1064-20121228/54919_1 /TAXON_ID=202472 /ORGANISM="Aulacoseira subarctica , Strain CCAP 1002/5" /LENGTH=61 /DNA_ID=CAMNT_0013176679 /DNA_START=757 /DNA_END=939 /DNA_ORIENTATION=-
MTNVRRSFTAIQAYTQGTMDQSLSTCDTLPVHVEIPKKGTKGSRKDEGMMGHGQIARRSNA